QSEGTRRERDRRHAVDFRRKEIADGKEGRELLSQRTALWGVPAVGAPAIARRSRQRHGGLHERRADHHAQEARIGEGEEGPGPRQRVATGLIEKKAHGALAVGFCIFESCPRASYPPTHLTISS